MYNYAKLIIQSDHTVAHCCLIKPVGKLSHELHNNIQHSKGETNDMKDYL